VAGLASLLLSRRTSRISWLESDGWGGTQEMGSDGVEVAFKPRGSSQWYYPDGSPVA
jgi:hypothetical protein